MMDRAIETEAEATPDRIGWRRAAWWTVSAALGLALLPAAGALATLAGWTPCG